MRIASLLVTALCLLSVGAQAKKLTKPITATDKTAIAKYIRDRVTGYETKLAAHQKKDAPAVTFMKVSCEMSTKTEMTCAMDYLVDHWNGQYSVMFTVDSSTGMLTDYKSEDFGGSY